MSNVRRSGLAVDRRGVAGNRMSFAGFPQTYATALFSFLYHLASYEQGEQLWLSGISPQRRWEVGGLIPAESTSPLMSNVRRRGLAVDRRGVEVIA